MLRKKKKPIKEIKRIQKRRTKALYQRMILTGVLSVIAIVFAFLFSQKPVLISPLSVLSMTTNGDPVKRTELELKKQNIISKSVGKHGDDIIITLDKNQEIILSADQDIGSELASLQLIMRQLTMEGKRFTRVDLRFDKPVIKFRE